MEIDDFLGHQTREGFGGILKWKENSPPQITVWLARKAKIYALWRHGFFRINSREKDGVTKETVWSDRLVCWDDEKTLRQAGKRDDDGLRTVPPVRCPMCKLVELIRARVAGPEADLEHWTPLFNFEAADESVVVYAGGFAGLWNDDLDESTQARIKKECREIVFGGPKANAFKQNAVVGANYLFSVVDNANPGGGIIKAIETASLGKAVQAAITKAKESLGDADLGNPIKNPYPIRFKYDKSKQFSEKYDAIRIEKFDLTPEILDAINGDPPDLSEELKFFDGKLLRSLMEEKCLVEGIEWGEIFSEPQPANPKVVSTVVAPKANAPNPPPKKPLGTAPAQPAKKTVAPKPAVVAAPPSAETVSVDDPDAWVCELLVDGTECGGLYKGDIPCTKCGTQYDANGKPLPKVAPAARTPRKRSEIAAAPPAMSAKPATRPKPAPVAEPEPELDTTEALVDEDLDEDRIPF
jgi:hypothetical protein